MQIYLRATNCTNHNNGIVSVELETQPLPRELSLAMEQLFPHFLNEAEELRVKEMLFDSFVPPEEAMRAIDTGFRVGKKAKNEVPPATTGPKF